MPYSPEHKARVRSRIVEAARRLFNRHGYDRVTIDQLMAEANLTRGGFYAHFANKEEVFAAATRSFLHGQGAVWRSEAGVDASACEPEMARRMVRTYLSREHLDAVEAQCPLIAYATDVGRAGPAVRESYQVLLEAMVGLYEYNLPDREDSRQRALAMAAMSVGGMILARSLPETRIAEEVREAALTHAIDLLGEEGLPATAG